VSILKGRQRKFRKKQAIMAQLTDFYLNITNE